MSNIQKMPAIGLVHKEDQYIIYFLMFSIPFEEKIDHFRIIIYNYKIYNFEQKNIIYKYKYNRKYN